MTILGAGGHAKVVIATLRALGVYEVRILDENPNVWGQSLLGIPVAGGFDLLKPGDTAHLAIGSNVARQSLHHRFGGVVWETIIHPTACVCPTAILGQGSFVGAGAVVQVEVQIGKHAIVNTGATIDHESVIGDFAQIAPGAHLGGRVQIYPRSFVGIGASVHQGAILEADSTLGGGAFLKGCLPEGETWVGVPARRLVPSTKE